MRSWSTLIMLPLCCAVSACDGSSNDAPGGGGAVTDGGVGGGAVSDGGGGGGNDAGTGQDGGVGGDGGSQGGQLATLKAFPTAVGFGRNTTGGRGGTVIAVTNLNDSGDGSLRSALAASGPRTIIFRVGGTISLATYLTVSNGDVTIAGQTAPGDGILLEGGELRIQTSNAVVRHVRIRPGNGATGSSQACVRIVAYSASHVSNVILDHVSMSWAADENLTITDASNQAGSVSDVTIQNCFITDNINTGYNAILFQENYDVSFFQNLFGYSNERNIRASDCGNRWEMINNYTYLYRTAALGTYENHADVIGNRWDVGAATPYSSHIFNLSASTNNCPDSNNALSRVYYEDNLKDGVPGTYGSDAVAALQSSRQVVSDIVPYAATLVKDRVLDEAGAYHHLPQGLDSFDSGRIADIIADTGSRMTSASYPSDYPTIDGGTAYPDANDDGIDDDWASAHGVTSASQVRDSYVFGSTTHVNTAGYDALEVFLADLAGDFD